MNRRDFLKTTLAAAALTALPKFTQAKGNKMKILVLTGSPRKNGNSNTLADYFIKGAREAGHEIVRFDAAFKDVHPCIACKTGAAWTDLAFSKTILNSSARTSSMRTWSFSQRRCTISAFPRS